MSLESIFHTSGSLRSQISGRNLTGGRQTKKDDEEALPTTPVVTYYPSSGSTVPSTYGQIFEGHRVYEPRWIRKSLGGGSMTSIDSIPEEEEDSSLSLTGP